MKVKAYIAHTFSLRHYIRDEVVPKLLQVNIKTFNPFYNQDGSTERPEIKVADEMVSKGIDPRQATSWMKMVKGKNKSIVKKDLKMIDKCDIIIAFMENWSGGTTCEIFYMGVVKERPVYLVTSNKIGIGEHPWMNYTCKRGKIVNSLEELIKILKRKYK